MKLEPLLYVSNLKKSVDFYTKILGFRLGEFYPDEVNSTYASIFIGDYKLMLVKDREDNSKFHPKGLGGSGCQLFVQVNNVDAIRKALSDKTILVDNIKDKSWGDREFTIRDPDGYLISFYSSYSQDA